MNQATMKITTAPGVPPAAWQGPLGKSNQFTQPPHTQKSGQSHFSERYTYKPQNKA